MNCEPIYYSGLGDCDQLFKRVVGFLVLDKGTAISDETLLATWQAIIADIGVDQKGIYLPISRGYQNNTAEPERVTSNLGITEKADDPNVALVGFLKGSYCDYKTLYGWDGRDVDFVAVLDNGQLWLTKDSDGNSIGFRANFTIRKNAPMGDNVAEGTPMYIDFLYKDEMDNGFVSTPSFTTRELRDSVPKGLSISVVTPWAANVVTVKVVKRCAPSQPYVFSSAVAGDFPILAAKSDVSPSISSVDDTNKAIGVYVLTTLSATDDLLIRAQDDDGSNQTYVSQPVTITI
jgi:hypothetical protein